jgi:hypothetical protein
VLSGATFPGRCRDRRRAAVRPVPGHHRRNAGGYRPSPAQRAEPWSLHTPSTSWCHWRDRGLARRADCLDGQIGSRRTPARSPAAAARPEALYDAGSKRAFRGERAWARWARRRRSARS